MKNYKIINLVRLALVATLINPYFITYCITHFRAIFAPIRMALR